MKISECVCDDTNLSFFVLKAQMKAAEEERLRAEEEEKQKEVERKKEEKRQQRKVCGETHYHGFIGFT